ncbi:acyl-peptide hydrolase [Streptomyces sp. 150FB]|uniref:prolyl oligopeptidase family serine peptidase n=1 Tax=Streptomyces sp. 150FB TaxID=1576605 RepID=UPI000589225D|nr:prolyl oligopeptidase family serine peptidase [Streptomyces sp. 150FB]KIF77650.1 acyl-peptide hydrolase [Streptomyces sp. 150FB]
MPTTGAYGTWPSPIDAALAASHDGRPDHLGAVGDELWWTEPRPAEAGRRALVRRAADGTEESVLPAPWNVRSRVIEYGGVPWAGAERAEGGPLIVFVHFPDQRLYAYEPDSGGEPRPLTPLSGVGDGLRWADPQVRLDSREVSGEAGGEVWCVLEEFTGDRPTDVRRVIAAVPLDGSAADDRTAVRELSDDRHHFVTGPRLSPDGHRVAWIAWDHPRMPWDGTEVMLGEVADGGPFTGVRAVLGGPEESICQVDWAPDGSLLFVSDRADWWQLHRVDAAALEVAADAGALTATSLSATSLCAGREEEFGGPLWKIGLQWFHPLENGLIAVIHGTETNALGILDPATGELVDAVGPWSEWASDLTVQGTRVTGIAASPRTGPEIVELDTVTGHTRVIASAHHDPLDPAYYPEALLRTFTGPGGREIHAQIHPPHHPGYTAPDGELPPYVIWAHGGPTSRTPLILDLETAYFTSRGIGVAKVNYGGSTGHGREYRNRLREQWGVVDVEDCAAVAVALADEGSADRDRLAVRGGSAGGWTTAASLAISDVYACGAISYPVLDLQGWTSDGTHDFESHYMESLIGPLAEVPERYSERSPLNLSDGVTAPFVLLQGLDDVICPPAQCDLFLERMAGRGVPHAYLAYEGEGHGFRRADTLISALEAELSLYAQTFGVERADIPRLELRK